MAGMPRGGRFALMLALLLLPALNRAAGGEVTVSFREPLRNWATRAAAPVYVDIRAERGATARVSLECGPMYGRGAYAMERTVSVPGDSPARIELTAFSGGAATVECSGVDSRGNPFRESTETRLDGGSGRYAYERTVSSPMICVNSFLAREFELLNAGGNSGDIRHESMPLADLPERWQSYMGLTAVMVINANDAASLGPGQREALARWVRWFGGRVALSGAGAAAAAERLGLAPEDAPDAGDDGLKWRAVRNGRVLVQEESRAATLTEAVREGGMSDPLDDYFYDSRHAAAPAQSLLRNMGGLPVASIIVSLVILGVVMGPLNYWYIRRKKSHLLFFVTTPLIALAGTIAIFLSSLVGEGFDSRYSQCAVLVRDTARDDAMLFNAMGVRMGFLAAMPEPRFTGDALALPFGSRTGAGRYGMDVTDGLRLLGGWFVPRFPSGLLVAKPVVSRMNLDVSRDGGEWKVTNNLGFAVGSLAARLPDGGAAWAESIPPGATAVLRRESDDSRLQWLIRDANRIFDRDAPFADISLVARCDGVPYLDNGGIDGARIAGEYYYVGLGGLGAEESR